MAENLMMEWALFYAAQGLAVFPLSPNDKYPIYKGGFKIATTDPKQIGQWWRRNPDANIGIATGQVSGGVFVIDLDVDENKGINGYETLRDWERDHKDLPDTANTITGRGGYHLFYRSDRQIKNRAGILPGMDIRGDGGYIVAPPSVHPNGTLYEWEQPIEDYGIAEADDQVYELLASGSDSNTNEQFSVPDQIPPGERNHTLYKMACSLQAKSFSDEAIKAMLVTENQKRCTPPLEDDEIEKILSSALSHKKGITPVDVILPNGSTAQRPAIELQKVRTKQKDQNGEPIYKVKQTIDNIATVLRQDPMLAGKIKYDVVGQRPKYLGQLPWHDEGDTIGEWADFDDSNLKAYLETNYDLKGKENYNDAFNKILNENRFNPIIDFLEALPEWDGKKRIDTLLHDLLGAEKSDYTAAVMHMFLMGALSRAYNPGCKFDYLLVLVGTQGAHKSYFLRRLAMADMWFDDNLNTIEGKEAAERLRGKWILELAELLAIKKQKDVEAIKAFITTQADSYRAPYERHSQDRKRFCVFAATTNDESFLTDRTGNRRFLPVKINKALQPQQFWEDSDLITSTFRQVWAEALHRFNEANKKPRLVLSEKMQNAAIEKQMAFLEDDPWVGLTQVYLDKTEKERICVMDIWRGALDEEKTPRRAESNRILAILRNEVEGWHEVGKQRTDYGRKVCFERDKSKENEWQPVDIPF